MYAFLFSLFVVLSLSSRAAAVPGDFRNQFAVLDDGKINSDWAKFTNIAKQFGYEWIIGEPYATAKASAAVDAGLKVQYNSNNARAAKWVRLNNPCIEPGSGVSCDSSGFSSPTKIAIGAGFLPLNSPLASQVLDDMQTALCMTAWGMTSAYNDLYDEAHPGTFKYQLYHAENKNAVIFVPNFRNDAGIQMNINQELRVKKLHEDNLGGKKIYSGLYLDETRFITGQPIVVNCPNATSPNASFEVGRKKFTKDLRTQMAAAVVAGGLTFGGMSGNPYTMDNFPVYGDPDLNFQLLFNESSGGKGGNGACDGCDCLGYLDDPWPNGCGTQDTTTYAPVPVAAVQTGLSPTNTSPAPTFHQRSYPGAALIEGRAAASGGATGISAWGGWFIGPLNPTFALTSIYLLRAIPSWDNLRGATGRTWTEGTDIYTSTNSFISQQMAWSRHKDYEQNHKLFFTKHSGTGLTFNLLSTEKIVDAKCTTFYFLEVQDNGTPTATCVTGYVSQSGNVVTIGANAVNDDGYVFYVHRAPTVLQAKVFAADQVDVCWNADDQGTIPMEGTSLTGWTFVVAGVQKTPTGPATITGLRCFHFTFATNTITTSSQVVTVAYNAATGFVTAGTPTINGGPKIPALSISPAITATNNLGGGNGGTPILATTRYQWQSNVGGAATAPLYNTLNAQLVPSAGGQARLIVKIRNTVNSHVTVPFPLYYQVDPADPTVQTAAVPVTDDCTAPVCYTPALGIGSLIPGVELLASDETANIDCGVIQSFNSIPFVTMSGSAGAGSEAECIYALKFKDTLTQGQNIYFYVREAGGNPLNTYPNAANMPRARIVDPRSDRVSGMVTGGTWR